MIVIVFGLPGSDKSYFASRLAKMIHAGHVNSDKVRKEWFKERVYSEDEKKWYIKRCLNK
ncbi:MAG TPA: AAA family ATPase [Hanamia sp.]|nr:AAA family ATPase [Hanamia sp.]